MARKTLKGSQKRGRSVDSLAELVQQARASEPREGAKELVLQGQLQGTLDSNELVVFVVGKHHALARSIHRPTGTIGIRDLQLSVKSAALAVELLGPRQVADEPVDLSSHEQQLLREGGFEEPRPESELPSDQGQLEYLALLQDSLSPEQAAKLLRVNSSRVRQRLGERQLFGVKDGRAWRLPRFQFAKHRLIPGIHQVLPALPPTLHPVAVQRWFRIPHPDLELADGTALTPLEWLAKGYEASRVVELAALL